MGEPLRLAVVGTGRMGRFHVETLATIDEVDVVAVVDPDADAASAAAEVSGAEHFTSLDQLVAATAVDAWLIAAPTPTHAALVEQAVERSVHVLCEKPLSLHLEDHDRLHGAASATGVVLQIGFWRRFSPPWAAAKRLIDSGAIGEPLMLRLSQWDADPPPPEFCDPEVSGGLAIDCGVHEYDLAEWFTGRRIVSVSARNLPAVDAAIAAAGDVDNVVAMLDLEDGLAATVDLSRNARYGDDVRTEILGSDGAILIDLLPTARARLATAGGIEVVPGSEAADGTAAGVAGQARAFASAVRGERRNVPDAAASRRALLVGRTVQAAADSRLNEVVGA